MKILGITRDKGRFGHVSFIWQVRILVDLESKSHIASLASYL